MSTSEEMCDKGQLFICTRHSLKCECMPLGAPSRQTSVITTRSGLVLSLLIKLFRRTDNDFVTILRGETLTKNCPIHWPTRIADIWIILVLVWASNYYVLVEHFKRTTFLFKIVEFYHYNHHITKGIC